MYGGLDPSGKIRWRAVFRVAVGAVVVTAAVLATPATAGGSLVVATAIVTGTFAVASGSAELIEDARGNPESADRIPDSYVDGTIGILMREFGVDENLTDAMVGAIDLALPSPSTGAIGRAAELLLETDEIVTMYDTGQSLNQYFQSLDDEDSGTTAAAGLSTSSNSTDNTPAPGTPSGRRTVQGQMELRCADGFLGHSVESGDSLWKLWREAGGNSSGTTWREMLDANNFLKNPNKLKIGWGVCKPECKK